MTLVPPPAHERTRRAAHWISFGFFTVLGVALAASPAFVDRDTSTTAAAGCLLLGLAVLMVPLLTWVRFLRRPAPARLVTPGPGPFAVEIRLRTDLPAATALLGTVWAALAAWAVVAGGATGGGLLAVPLVLLGAALVPDPLRAALRRPRLSVDADGVRLRGWSLDADLDWADTVGIEVVSVRPRRPVIRLLSTGGAPSLRRTWHRYVLRVDLLTEAPAVDIALLALAAPERVPAFLTVLRGLPRQERERELNGPGLAFLRGEITLDR